MKSLTIGRSWPSSPVYGFIERRDGWWDEQKNLASETRDQLGQVEFENDNFNQSEIRRKLKDFHDGLLFPDDSIYNLNLKELANILIGAWGENQKWSVFIKGEFVRFHPIFFIERGPFDYGEEFCFSFSYFFLNENERERNRNLLVRTLRVLESGD